MNNDVYILHCSNLEVKTTNPKHQPYYKLIAEIFGMSNIDMFWGFTDIVEPSSKVDKIQYMEQFYFNHMVEHYTTVGIYKVNRNACRIFEPELWSQLLAYGRENKYNGSIYDIDDRNIIEICKKIKNEYRKPNSLIALVLANSKVVRKVDEITMDQFVADPESAFRLFKKYGIMK